MTPVTVLTGFLGSGKTTLLNRLLRAPELAGALVLVNEFGEIGLDHHLIESVEATFVLLDNGCLCCRVRSDLAETLADMASKRRRGQVPAFDRVIVETTGMADPLPILQTIVSDPRLLAWYRLDRVIATVDGALGLDTLGRYEEAARQTALADMVLVTKGDMAGGSLDGLEEAIRALNADAPILDARRFSAGDLQAGLWQARERGRSGGHDLGGHDHADHPHGDHPHGDHPHGDHPHGDHAPGGRHTAGIAARSVTFDRPIPWPAFAAWAQQLIEDRRGDLLRLKAILNVAGRARPVVAHGVQHHFYPPGELEDWPDGDRRSRLVVIGRNLSQEELQRRLDALLAAVPAE